MGRCDGLMNDSAREDFFKHPSILDRNIRQFIVIAVSLEHSFNFFQVKIHIEIFMRICKIHHFDSQAFSAETFNAKPSSMIKHN